MPGVPDSGKDQGQDQGVPEMVVPFATSSDHLPGQVQPTAEDQDRAYVANEPLLVQAAYLYLSDKSVALWGDWTITSPDRRLQAARWLATQVEGVQAKSDHLRGWRAAEKLKDHGPEESTDCECPSIASCWGGQTRHWVPTVRCMHLAETVIPLGDIN